MHNEVKLLPCRECGSECRVETFGGGIHVTPTDLWICSNGKIFGGDCPSDLSYIGADAWNEANRRPTIVTDEVVERDPEADAWDWLDSKFLNVEAGHDPNDRDYSADDMVDAFMAGAARASIAAMPAIVR